MPLTDTEIETDLDFIKGELLNIQTELTTYFGAEGIVLPSLAERLEGIEARVGEVADRVNTILPMLHAVPIPRALPPV